MTRRPGLLLTCFGLLGAAPASAATVDVGVREQEGGWEDWELRYVAAPGERNDVTVTTVDDRTVRIADRGASIVAGPRCRSIAAGEAECTIAGEPTPPRRSPYLYIARIEAGDGDDVVRSSGEWGPLLRADGGIGSDMLEGALRRGDVLDGGGGGADRLAGRGNNDTLTDGDATGAADADVLDAGTGFDAVSYAARTADLAVDLSAGSGGEVAENDVLRGLESATGGSGDDELDGTAAMNMLDGGDGDDHLDGHGSGDALYGRDGRDTLHGHDGSDGLDGGAGADRLRGDAGSDAVLRPSRDDAISCGRGIDGLVQPGDGVVVGRRCEGLRYEFDPQTGGRSIGDEGTLVELAPFPVARTRSSLTFSVGCPRPADTAGLCSMTTRQTLRLRAAGSGRLLGVGRLDRRRYERMARAERGTRSRIVVRLTPAGRRLLARRGGVLTTAGLATGDYAEVRWAVRLGGRSQPTTPASRR